MQTVIRTSIFLADAQRAGLTEEQQMEMISEISREPTLGELMVGTGGCRKARFPGKGKGKSGGYRTVHYFAGNDVPILLLALIDGRSRQSQQDGAQRTPTDTCHIRGRVSEECASGG